jgi:hypothetical protein
VIGMFAEEGYPLNNYWKQLAVPFMYRRWVKAEEPERGDDSSRATS